MMDLSSLAKKRETTFMVSDGNRYSIWLDQTGNSQVSSQA